MLGWAEGGTGCSALTIPPHPTPFQANEMAGRKISLEILENARYQTWWRATIAYTIDRTGYEDVIGGADREHESLYFRLSMEGEKGLECGARG